MAQKRKGPRLYLRNRGKSRIWVIRHGQRMIATGFQEGEEDLASGVLDAYCAELDMRPGAASTQRIMRQSGFVYFVSCVFPSFPIKIGWSASADVRLKSLQCALPYKIILMGMMSGTLADEKRLHTGFRQYRLVGEWFERNPDLLKLINSHNIRAAA